MKINSKTKELVTKVVNLALAELREDQIKEEGITKIDTELIDLINIYIEDILRYDTEKIIEKYFKIIA